MNLNPAQVQDVVNEYVQKFRRLVLQNSDAPMKTDQLRRQELTARGKKIGQGLVHGNNECCADSLLQLMAGYKFVPPEIGGHMRYAVNKRREACAACRFYLVNHDNPQLQPRRRDESGAVADVSKEEHASAYLPHDVHGEAMF